MKTKGFNKPKDGFEVRINAKLAKRRLDNAKDDFDEALEEDVSEQGKRFLTERAMDLEKRGHELLNANLEAAKLGIKMAETDPPDDDCKHCK